LRIRAFTMKDFAAVSELWRRSGLENRPGDSREEVLTKLNRDSDLFLVAEERSKIVGVAMGAWDGRRGWVYHLAVDPASRRRGIATKMLLEVERRMKKNRVPRIHSLVFAWNTPSLELFDSLGYERQSDLIVLGKTLKRG
jgi:ribosomal protein S18 acetylase RimI-like enzyme